MSDAKKPANPPMPAGVTEEHGSQAARISTAVSGSVVAGLTAAMAGGGVLIPIGVGAAAAIAAFYMSRNDGAQYVSLKYDPAVASFLDVVGVARDHAETGYYLLYVGVRRTDQPGHPWVCEWTRRKPTERWEFAWKNGATREEIANPAPELPLGPLRVETRTLAAGETSDEIQFLVPQQGYVRITEDGPEQGVRVTRAEIGTTVLFPASTADEVAQHILAPGANFRLWLRNTGSTPTNARVVLVGK